jgi:hypothetical protein
MADDSPNKVGLGIVIIAALVLCARIWYGDPEACAFSPGAERICSEWVQR